MRVDELFPPEVIDEDIRKWAGGAVAAGALAALPMGVTNTLPQQSNYEASIAHDLSVAMAKDISIMAQTMWGEARSHGAPGMLAVGSVIKNRAEADRGLTFGNGIRGVSLKRKQFSCWNENDPNRQKIEAMREIAQAIKYRQSPEEGKSFEEWYTKFQQSNDFREYQAWETAYQLAAKIVKGQVQDPTNGALFYHTTGVRPKWSIDAEPIGQLANHVFYRRVS